MRYQEMVEWLAALRRGTAPVATPAAGPLDVTVSMPARNAADFIEEAVRSVLAQEGVGFELVVVDDASEDDTAARVDALGDPRVRLLQSPRRRGIGASHNHVLEVARGRFLAHVDADDVLLPGALDRMVAALRESADAAQAYCHHYTIDGRGRIERDEYDRQRAAFARRRPGHDYRRELLQHGMAVNALRTYRKEALAATGPFDESLPFAVDYEMAVRLADRYDLLLVPAFLYCQRIHGGNVSEARPFRALRSWVVRARICRRLLQERGALLGRSPGEVHRLLGLGLLDALGIVRAAKSLGRRAGPGPW